MKPRSATGGPLVRALVASMLLAPLSTAASPSARADDGNDSEPAPTETATATLRVVVVELRSDDGDVEIAVADSPASWSGDAPSFRGTVAPIENRRAEFVFEDVPAGEYAVKLFHDENDNDRFDLFFGLPREPYAFSNGAEAYFGPPSFERAKFAVDAPVTTIEIELN